MKELPLRSIHTALGGKLIPFAGWNMPVQYSGIKEEHLAVRERVGIFDVSHMGELFVKGEDAASFLSYISTNAVSSIAHGKAQYGLLLNHAGGVIDDIIVYRLSDTDFFVCANASNVDTVYSWFSEKILEGNVSVAEAERKSFNCTVENISDSYAQFAVQGPLAMKLLQAHFGEDDTSMKRFSFSVIDSLSTPDFPCILARTGYSGEDGCEIFLPAESGEKVWTSLFKTAEEHSIPLIPCGLGARDTLRLEACLPLHGHEIREDITPLSAKLDRFVNFEKGFFIGAPALEHQKQVGVSPVLTGLEVEGNGIIRAEYPVVHDGKTVGWVTSGTRTPSLNRSIGLALVLSGFESEGKDLFVKIRDKEVPVKRISMPFYRKS
jgi:aminomethyltransferase